MKDDALTVCPSCGGHLRKVFGAPMISFKGSGFYATDHGKKSKSSERSSEQKDGKQGADPKPTSTSSETKDGGSEKKGSDKAPAAKKEPTSDSSSSSKPAPKKEQTS
jgi:hypothetical protein